MRTVSPSRKPGTGSSDSKIIHQALEINYNIRKSNSSLIWGCVNVAILAIVLYDLNQVCPFYHGFVQYVEYTLALICSLNIIYHFCRFLYNRIKTQAVTVTPLQKKLLGVKNSDTYYKVASTPPNSPSFKSPTQSSTPMNMSALSWRSVSSQNDSNYSVSSPSWVYYQGSPEKPQESPLKIAVPDTSGIEYISNEESLQQYLKDYDNNEKAALITCNTDDTTNLLSSFWSHPASRSCSEVSSLLKNSVYQLATHAIGKLMPGTAVTTESRSPVSTQNDNIEIWKKLKIDFDTLTQWNANLRMWIFQTILNRLVNEINSVDKALQRHGFSDVKIGMVGLERLRKTAQTQQALQHVPTLLSLISFLEISSNQDYLVKRIKELAKGGSMSEYRWNSGSSFNGKDWEDNLPTDAMIILHLVVTYLDTQLVPLPHQPEARPFTTRHFLKRTTKPGPNSATVLICEVSERPPHYNLIVEGETQEVGMGRNNLFHTLLLFLFQVNKVEHGMLGRVNLGPSGVNMLWIIGQ